MKSSHSPAASAGARAPQVTQANKAAPAPPNKIIVGKSGKVGVLGTLPSGRPAASMAPKVSSETGKLSAASVDDVTHQGMQISQAVGAANGGGSDAASPAAPSTPAAAPRPAASGAHKGGATPDGGRWLILFNLLWDHQESWPEDSERRIRALEHEVLAAIPETDVCNLTQLALIAILMQEDKVEVRLQRLLRHLKGDGLDVVFYPPVTIKGEALKHIRFFVSSIRYGKTDASLLRCMREVILVSEALEGADTAELQGAARPVASQQGPVGPQASAGGIAVGVPPSIEMGKPSVTPAGKRAREVRQVSKAPEAPHGAVVAAEAAAPLASAAATKARVSQTVPLDFVAPHGSAGFRRGVSFKEAADELRSILRMDRAWAGQNSTTNAALSVVGLQAASAGNRGSPGPRAGQKRDRSDLLSYGFDEAATESTSGGRPHRLAAPSPEAADRQAQAQPQPQPLALQGGSAPKADNNPAAGSHRQQASTAIGGAEAESIAGGAVQGAVDYARLEEENARLRFQLAAARDELASTKAELTASNQALLLAQQGVASVGKSIEQFLHLRA